MPAPRRVSVTRFDGIVSTWNRTNPDVRSAKRQHCFDRGHRYIEPPFSTVERVTYVCQDCLQYLEPGPQAPRAIRPRPVPALPWVHPHWWDVDASIKRWKAAGCPVDPEPEALAA